MKTIAVKANLTNRENITNHSACKTMIQKLNDNQVPPTHIMQISGHKNVQSIRQQRLKSEFSTIANYQYHNQYWISNQRTLSSTNSELSANCGLSSIFANSTISGNTEININNHVSRKPPVKRKRLVIESSDSSQEWLLFTFWLDENANF